MDKNEAEQLRLLKGYIERKLKQFEGLLDLLIRFARDDLKRLDKLQGKIEQE